MCSSTSRCSKHKPLTLSDYYYFCFQSNTSDFQQKPFRISVQRRRSSFDSFIDASQCWYAESTVPPVVSNTWPTAGCRIAVPFPLGAANGHSTVSRQVLTVCSCRPIESSEHHFSAHVARGGFAPSGPDRDQTENQIPNQTGNSAHGRFERYAVVVSGARHRPTAVCRPSTRSALAAGNVMTSVTSGRAEGFRFFRSQWKLPSNQTGTPPATAGQRRRIVTLFSFNPNRRNPAETRRLWRVWPSGTLSSQTRPSPPPPPPRHGLSSRHRRQPVATF